jgi:hypothetical protein
MKNLTKALSLTAVSGALIACSTQYFSTSTDTPGAMGPFHVLGATAPKKPKGPKLRPFFRMESIEPHLEDMDAMALVMPDETLPDGGAPTKVKFSVKGQEKWSPSSGSFLTGGHMEFEDKGRKLKFKGDVDDDGLYITDQNIYAHIEGVVKDVKDDRDKGKDKDKHGVPDEGYRFSLDIYDLSPTELTYEYCVTLANDDSTPIYSYKGTADKGNLKINLH